MGELYRTVIDEFIQKGDWGSARSLTGLECEDRPGWIRENLLLAAEHYHDEGALSAWPMLARAIADVHLLPLTTIKNDRREYVYLAKWAEAFRVAKEAEAVEAGKLLDLLPRHKERWEERPNQITGRGWERVTVQDRTLPKTKEALLAAVAEGWKTAAEEDRADQFFTVLLNFWRQTKFLEEKDLVEKALKKAMEVNFPPGRLERQIKNLAPFGPSGVKIEWGDQRLVGVLAKGWNREASPEYTSQLVHLSLPLRGTSPAAYFWLAEQAKAIAAADSELKPLLLALQYFYSAATIVWADPGRVRLRIVADSRSYCNPREENQHQLAGNRIFDEAREKVLEWRAQHSNIKLCLEVVIPKPYDPNQVFFQRSDEF